MKGRNIDGPQSIGTSVVVVLLLEPEIKEQEQKTVPGARQAQ